MQAAKAPFLKKIERDYAMLKKFVSGRKTRKKRLFWIGFGFWSVLMEREKTGKLKPNAMNLKRMLIFPFWGSC